MSCTRLIFLVQTFFFSAFCPDLVTLWPFFSPILSFFQLEQRRKIGVHLGYFKSGSKSRIFTGFYSIKSVHKNQKKPFFTRNSRNRFGKFKYDSNAFLPSPSPQTRPNTSLDHLETPIAIDSLSVSSMTTINTFLFASFFKPQTPL